MKLRSMPNGYKEPEESGVIGAQGPIGLGNADSLTTSRIGATFYADCGFDAVS